ncbi:MAG: chemotaxis-specific protein-glutamate methyltransferase CheB [Candidatus Methanomethylicaceae archaeon]
MVIHMHEGNSDAYKPSSKNFIGKKKRILVAEDSALMRAFLRDFLTSEGFDVITVRNGKEALDVVSKLSPDAAILDINMPIMDGLSVLREFVRMRIPSVMFSHLTVESSSTTMEALEIGAIDFVTKPSPPYSDINNVKKELLSKLKIAIVSKNIPSIRRNFIGRPLSFEAHQENLAKKVILVAASTGGPSMIKSILSDLPRRLGASILIVQHMPPIFTKAFAASLSSTSFLQVKEAEYGELIYENRVYVAPGDFHMEVMTGARILLHKGEKVNFVRPSADTLFFSAARHFGSSTLAVILSGMGSDGAKGALAIKNVGGHVIVQDEATSVVYGMPKAAIEVGAVDEVLSIDEIPKRIVDLL